MEEAVALVTGGSRGIGRAVAIRLAKDHRYVAITYREAAAEADAVVGDIIAMGRGAVAIKCDLGNSRLVPAVVEQVVATFGALDTLVNNAGGAKRRRFGDISYDEWTDAIAVNLTSPFTLMQAALPHMIARGGGSIVNIGSPAGLRGGVLGAHYSASKAGLRGLTVQASRELTVKGIRVNSVDPAAIETEIVKRLLAEGEAEGLRIVPAGGRRGTPEEVAEVVGFLCSPAASFVSGAVIDVAGGGL